MWPGSSPAQNGSTVCPHLGKGECGCMTDSHLVVCCPRKGSVAEVWDTFCGCGVMLSPAYLHLMFDDKL